MPETIPAPACIVSPNTTLRPDATTSAEPPAILSLDAVIVETPS